MTNSEKNIPKQSSQVTKAVNAFKRKHGMVTSKGVVKNRTNQLKKLSNARNVLKRLNFFSNTTLNTYKNNSYSIAGNKSQYSAQQIKNDRTLLTDISDKINSIKNLKNKLKTRYGNITNNTRKRALLNSLNKDTKYLNFKKINKINKINKNSKNKLAKIESNLRRKLSVKVDADPGVIGGVAALFS